MHHTLLYLPLKYPMYGTAPSQPSSFSALYVNEENGSHSFLSAMQISFGLSNYCLLTLNDNTVGVWQDEFGTYYLFDSHARNVLGQPDSDGTAVLLHFEKIESLSAFIHKTYASAVLNGIPLAFGHVEDNVERDATKREFQRREREKNDSTCNNNLCKKEKSTSSQQKRLYNLDHTCCSTRDVIPLAFGQVEDSVERDVTKREFQRREQEKEDSASNNKLCKQEKALQASKRDCITWIIHIAL